MKKILICLMFFCLKGYTQELKDFHAPKGYELVQQAEGDLDKDGIPEIVYVYNTNLKVKELGYPRVLYICKKVKGKFKLWKENRSVLWKSEDCGFFASEGVPLEVMIENNTLIVEQTFNHNSRHQSKYKNIFRYQNSDWYLIGSTYNNFDTCDYDFQYDINFSTKKVSIQKTYGSCDDDEKKVPEDESYNFSYPFKGIPKMDGFTAGKKELQRAKDKMYFFY